MQHLWIKVNDWRAASDVTYHRRESTPKPFLHILKEKNRYLIWFCIEMLDTGAAHSPAILIQDTAEQAPAAPVLQSNKHPWKPSTRLKPRSVKLTKVCWYWSVLFSALSFTIAAISPLKTPTKKKSETLRSRPLISLWRRRRRRKTLCCRLPSRVQRVTGFFIVRPPAWCKARWVHRIESHGRL